MRRLATAPLLLILAAAPLPAIAAPVKPAATAAEAQARMDTLMRDLAAFGQPYNEAVTRAEQLVVTVVAGAQKVTTDYGRGLDEKTMTAWAHNWAGEVRQEETALKAEQAALPPAPGAAFDKLGMGPNPEVAMLRRAYEKMPAATEVLFTSVYDVTDKTLPLVEKAASGDSDALVGASQQITRGVRISLLAENTMLDVSISSSPGSPLSAFARSVKASNEAVMAMLDSQIAAYDGSPTDSKDLARTIHAKAAQARSAAAEIEPIVAKQAQAVAGHKVSPQLNAKLTGILDVYRQSAKIELQVADLMDRVGDRLDQGLEVGDAMGADQAQLSALVERRQAAQRERMRLMAQ